LRTKHAYLGKGRDRARAIPIEEENRHTGHPGRPKTKPPGARALAGLTIEKAFLHRDAAAVSGRRGW